jgi:hypothetical protein
MAMPSVSETPTRYSGSKVDTLSTWELQTYIPYVAVYKSGFILTLFVLELLLKTIKTTLD